VFTQSDNSNVHFVQSCPHRHTQIVFNQISEHPVGHSNTHPSPVVVLSGVATCDLKHVDRFILPEV
jgi:hypothetical protein